MEEPIQAYACIRLEQGRIERAQGRCEYCHKPQVTFLPHEVDHVVPLTPEGRVTVFLLHINDPERVQERQALKVHEMEYR